MMDLKYVVPNMEGTFGTLEYAGAGKTVMLRVNGAQKVAGRIYNLFSSCQRADNIEVQIPGDVGEKRFEFEERVTLINPRIVAEGYGIGDRGYSNYVLLADDIVKA